MKKILVAVDMQKDFVDGALGTAEAVKIVPNVAAKIKAFQGDEIFVTFDTHGENYAETLEGKKLPVAHCIEGTEGHKLIPEAEKALEGKKYTRVFKKTFGTFEIAQILAEKYPGEEIEADVIGLCTDICVISNALILRAAFPNSKIRVDASCCAGVTPQSHEAALLTMSCCQIDVVR